MVGPVSTNLHAALPLPMDRLEAFCEARGIVELSLFGSILRDDFGPGSDVDVLVTFRPGAGTDLFELMEMEAGLARIVGRPVHLVSRRAIEQSRNWLRRREILGSAKTLLRTSAA